MLQDHPTMREAIDMCKPHLTCVPMQLLEFVDWWNDSQGVHGHSKWFALIELCLHSTDLPTKAQTLDGDLSFT